jgi:hypothetical protein
MPTLHELEEILRRRLDALVHPDFERADRIGEFWSYPQSRAFAELLIRTGTAGSSPVQRVSTSAKSVSICAPNEEGVDAGA